MENKHSVFRFFEEQENNLKTQEAKDAWRKECQEFSEYLRNKFGLSHEEISDSISEKSGFAEAMSAYIDPNFAAPPYRAELFNEKSGWAGVMNAHGFNVLRFAVKPGAVVTSFENAQKIANEWNGDKHAA